jgi:nucleoside-diphosphate-sugar epimerase
MKVALTGVTGIVGGSIAAALRRHGHEVLCLSRRPCDGHHVPYRLEDDPSRLPWQGVDALIHAAHDFTARTREEIAERNVRPSIALFEAAARAGVSRRVFISSMSSFEGCRSDYGLAKRVVENEVLRHGARVVRPGLVWATKAGGVMAALEHAVRCFPVVPYPVGGNAAQFLIHADDLAEAVTNIIENPPPDDGGPLTLAHAAPLHLRDILRIIARRKPHRRLWLPVPWQVAMAGLKAAELAGIRLSVRSDSLTGLVRGNPAPRIDEPPAGVTFRPFS